MNDDSFITSQSLAEQLDIAGRQIDDLVRNAWLAPDPDFLPVLRFHEQDVCELQVILACVKMSAASWNSTTISPTTHRLVFGDVNESPRSPAGSGFATVRVVVRDASINNCLYTYVRYEYIERTSDGSHFTNYQEAAAPDLPTLASVIEDNLPSEQVNELVAECYRRELDAIKPEEWSDFIATLPPKEDWPEFIPSLPSDVMARIREIMQAEGHGTS